MRLGIKKSKELPTVPIDFLAFFTHCDSPLPPPHFAPEFPSHISAGRLRNYLILPSNGSSMLNLIGILSDSSGGSGILILAPGN